MEEPPGRPGLAGRLTRPALSHITRTDGLRIPCGGRPPLMSGHRPDDCGGGVPRGSGHADPPLSRTEANSIQPCPSPGKCCLNGRLRLPVPCLRRGGEKPPRYREAVEAELAENRKGNYNFRGVVYKP